MSSGERTSYDQLGGWVNGIGGGKIVDDIFARWVEYKKDYYASGNNILEAHIFENKGIMEGNETIDSMVFTRARYQTIRGNLRGFNFRSMVDEQFRVKAKREVEIMFDMEITWVEYFRLRTNIQRCVDRRIDSGNIGKNISGLMARGNLKSSKLRKQISGRDSREYMENNPLGMASLRTLWGRRVEVKERRFVELNLRIWKISVLEPDFKEFCFKLLYGRLYLNLSLSHFSDTSPGCTFCTVRKGRELKSRRIEPGTVQYEREITMVDPETVEHLFWGCREVNQLIIMCINNLAGTRGENVSVIRYWEGAEIECNVDAMLSILVVRFIQYAVYRCRVRRKIPLMVNINNDVEFLLEQLNRRTKWRGAIQRLRETVQRILE
jgi:hypothetical protein